MEQTPASDHEKDMKDPEYKKMFNKALTETQREIEVIKALSDYNMGKISGERCAEIIGINTFEFMELYGGE